MPKLSYEWFSFNWRLQIRPAYCIQRGDLNQNIPQSGYMYQFCSIQIKSGQMYKFLLTNPDKSNSKCTYSVAVANPLSNTNIRDDSPSIMTGKVRYKN